MTRFPSTTHVSWADVTMLTIPLAGCGLMATSDVSLHADTDIEMARQRQNQEKVKITSPATHLSLIHRMQEQGLYHASLTYIDACQQRYDHTLGIILLRVDALCGTDQLAVADTEYRAVVVATPATGAGMRDRLLNTAAQCSLGIVAGRQGSFVGAARRLQVAIQVNPADADIASDPGYALMRSGEVEQARVSLMQTQQMTVTSPKIAGNLVIRLTVNGRKDDATSLTSHARLTVSVCEVIDEGVVRVQGVWRDRRIARDTTADATRVVALSPSAAGVARATTPAITTQSHPLALQHGRLLDILETVQ